MQIMVNPAPLVSLVLIILALSKDLWLGKYSNRSLIKFIILPFLFLFAWAILIIYQSFEIEHVVTILTKEYSRQNLSQFSTSELYQGQTIKGSFTATNDNLGIVGFRFWTFYRLNDDYLEFKIRDINSAEWYYTHSYKADQFQPNQYFTLGFPIISNSKSRTYEFEITSTLGSPGNAVGTSVIDPVFIAKYKYPTKLITSSPKKLVKFLFLKAINLLEKSKFDAASTIYLLPLILYLVSITRPYNQVKNKALKYVIGQQRNVSHMLLSYIYLQKRNLSLVIIGVGLFLDIFFVQNNDVTMILLLILCLYIKHLYNFSQTLFFRLSIILVVVSAINYYLTANPLISERSGAWVLIFLVITLGMNIYDESH